jgi:hypothetical protein
MMQYRSGVEADMDSQNPRAKPLRNKDLIHEFRNYSAQTEMLALHALLMFFALKFPLSVHGQKDLPRHKLTKRRRRLVEASGRYLRTCAEP